MRKSNAVLKSEAIMDNQLIPTNCPSCDSKLVVEGIHLRCVNESCDEQNILTILHWVTNCGIEHFAESSVRALYAAGKLKTVKDLYKLNEKSFAGIEGFGSRKIENALSEIERTKEMTLASFIDKLSIDLVGEKAVAKLGIKTFDEFMNWTDTTFVVGKNIKEFVKENRQYILDLASCVVLKEVKAVATKAGAKKIAMTGSGPDKRNNLIERISANGDVFHDGVHKDTDILLCEDKNSGSSKLVKAQKMGVKIMNYSEYFK
jgi:DNA ligase (NAD+)